MSATTTENNTTSKPIIGLKSITSLSSLKGDFDGCINMEECDSLHRIKDALFFYQQKKQDNDIMEYYDKYKDLIDDYHHIILEHTSTGNRKRDNDNFAIIDSIIGKTIKCDIAKCKNYKRNHRNRGKQIKNTEYKEEDLMNNTFKLEHSSYDVSDDNNVIFYKEFMDSIHCYFVHSIDVGFRMQIEDDTKDDNKYDNDEIDIKLNEDLYKDTQIQKINDNFKKRREKLAQISGVQREKYNKFTTDISADYLQKEQVEVESKENKENNDSDSKIKDEQLRQEGEKITVYSFGYKFYYWDFYVDREWFIPKEYSNFKQEMLQHIELKQYINTELKALRMLDTVELRKLQSYEWKNYNIPMGKSIELANILAISFYTDYTHLSFLFGETFRKIGIDKTNVDIKNRNAQYREWSRILRETVECYGTTMEQTKIKVFYHGVSMMYFDSFIATFCCPTSTTAQLEVATNFADTNGVILELEKSSIGNSLRYFNCSLLSVFGSEDERLFIGGKQPLQFKSIRVVKNRHNYKHFIKALSLFDKIINSQMLSENEIKKVTKMDYKVIDKMIKRQVNNEENKFPEYINICFQQFVNNKKIIKFNLGYMIEQYPMFCKTFLDQNHNNYFLNNMDNNLLAFDFIANIFQQCQEIHSIRTDPKQNVFVGQGFMYLDSLIPILNKINKNEKIKLKIIRIFGKRDLTDNDLYTNFKTYILDKTQWNLKIHDNQLIIMRNLK